jgi:polyisoprenoid-binding protein YceI
MSMKKTILVFVMLGFPAFAAQYSFELSPENTKIQWTLGDVLHKINGQFTLKRGRIDFDTEDGKASGKLIVDVASGNSGSEARDHRMHANVLESAKYPEATFVPNTIEGAIAPAGTSHVKVAGVLTLHGTGHQITIDAEVAATADRTRATMTFNVPYVAWGMKDPSNFLLRVDKTVKVSIEAAGPLTRH